MPVSPKIIWGSINANGTIASGENFTVSRIGTGVYEISFHSPFNGLPAVVGSQNRFGELNEASTDDVAFPFVSNGATTAVTGNNGGEHEDRNFAFIAIGL